MKIADLSLVVCTHHGWANTDIVNLAIIDGLTKKLCRKNCCPICYDVYQCIVADVEYFCCAFIMRGGPVGVIFTKPPLKVWVYKTSSRCGRARLKKCCIRPQACYGIIYVPCAYHAWLSAT